MKWRMLAYILLAALVITACQQSPTQPTGANPPALSSTQPATNPAASSANAYQYIFDTTPNPINIRVTLDTGQSVEATIPVEGGTLSATGSDGTTYILEIP